MSVAQFAIPPWAELTAVAIASMRGAMGAFTGDEQRLDLLGVELVGTATALSGARLEAADLH